MGIQNLLAEKKADIVKEWRNCIIASYPEESQGFLKKEKSQFANPVGLVISNEIEPLYDELIKEDGDEEKIAFCLENIIRIRAVQDFKPSQAVSFVMELKGLVKGALGDGYSAEMRDFDSRIDQMALLAFDIYAKCRQKLFEIRVNEVKHQVGRLLERANLISEIPEYAPDLKK
jgi:hypothetical protein